MSEQPEPSAPGLREIMERYIARHILDDAEGFIEQHILAWHEARCREYGETVREACARALCWECQLGKPHDLADCYEHSQIIRALPIAEVPR